MTQTILPSGKGKTMKTIKKISGFQRKWERDEDIEYRQILESENNLYDVIMMNMCYYTFAQTHRKYKAKSGS